MIKLISARKAKEMTDVLVNKSIHIEEVCADIDKEIQKAIKFNNYKMHVKQPIIDKMESYLIYEDVLTTLKNLEYTVIDNVNNGTIVIDWSNPTTKLIDP